MDANSQKILEIAHGYTQRRIALDSFPGKAKGIWNHKHINETGNSTSKFFIRAEGDEAIVGTEQGEEEDRWKLSDLVLGVAVKEAQGFVMFQPSRSVEEVVADMLSANGHGYGFLIDEGNFTP